MKSNTIFKVLLALLGLAFSLFLAGGGDGYSIPTPGVLAARVLAPPRAYPNELQSLGESLRVQIFVDWVFWFAVMYAAYFFVKKIVNDRTKDVRKAGR